MAGAHEGKAVLASAIPPPARSRRFARRVIALLAGLVVLVVLALLYVVSAERPSPRYKGRTISFWVGGIKLPNREADRFVSTVLEIGSPAVPVLMSEFRAQNSSFRRSQFYRAFWNVLPDRFQSRFARPASPVGSRPALAYTLAMMGPDALPALPVLTQGARDRARDVRLYSIWALGQLGATSVIEIISHRLTDSDAAVREQAKRALETIAFLQRQRQTGPQ